MEKSLSKSKTFLLILLIVFSSVRAQNNLLNNSEIYDFLERFDSKGIITINHHSKPFDRIIILNYLKEIRLSEDKLTELNRAELAYFLNEYASDNNNNDRIYFIENNSNNAFRIFEYNDNDNRLVLYPDFGLSYAYRNSVTNTLNYYNGFSGYGNIGNVFSFDFDFNDISVRNKGYTIQSLFTPERGFDYPRYNSESKTLNYDRTLGSVATGWDWGYIALKKDYNYWGTGYSGKIIISDKAPSFPQLFFKARPWEWLEFSYLYGELNSSINDSSTFRNSGGTRTHIQLVEKYFAAHMITFDLLKDLKVSIGESVIISDRFEPIYLIPVLFFRMADHYLSHSDLNSGNAQVFSSLSYRIPSLSSRLDFSFFIDEMSIAKSSGSNALGYSFGFTKYDLLFNNFDVQLEYVRIDPFVYGHGDPAQTYANRKYFMGHWIGSNSDLINLSMRFIPMLNTVISASAYYIRKGDFDDINQPRYQPEQTFLYGEKSYYLIYKLGVSKEIFNNIFIYSNLMFSNAWGKNNLIKTTDYKYTEFEMGAKIGFR